MVTANNKEEKISIGVDDQVIELTGKDKEAFLEQRAKDKAEFEALLKQQEEYIELKKSAYKKIGLTEAEINAIL